MKHIALAALVLAACTRPAPAGAPRDAAGDSASSTARPAAIDTSRTDAHDSASLWPERGTVMPLAVMPDLLQQCSRPSPEKDSVEGYWTPGAAQIRELEAGLTPLLRDSLNRIGGGRTATVAQHLAVYHRQYAGLVMNGRRIIYVNGFVQSPEMAEATGDTTRWRELPTQVCDGGEAFFGVEYDPATRRFRNLHFNGLA